MRKTLPTAFCLLLAATLAPREAPAQNSPEYDKFNAKRVEAIKEVYMEMYARGPYTDELDFWTNVNRHLWKWEGSATAAETTKKIPEKKPIIARELHLRLRKPEGASDLRDIARLAYGRSFGREPPPEEYERVRKLVSGEAVGDKVVGYRQLVTLHKLYLMDPRNDSDRRAIITLAYSLAYGRPPTTDNFNYWLDRVKKDGSNFIEIRNACLDYMRGSRDDQMHEMKEVLRRAADRSDRVAPEITLDTFLVVQGWVDKMKALEFNERPFDWLVNLTYGSDYFKKKPK
jgi:hypothetical protein